MRIKCLRWIQMTLPLVGFEFSGRKLVTLTFTANKIKKIKWPELMSERERERAKKKCPTISDFSSFIPPLHSSTSMPSLLLLVWLRTQLPEARYTFLTTNQVAAAVQQPHLTGSKVKGSKAAQMGLNRTRVSSVPSFCSVLRSTTGKMWTHKLFNNPPALP